MIGSCMKIIGLLCIISTVWNSCVAQKHKVQSNISLEYDNETDCLLNPGYPDSVYVIFFEGSFNDSLDVIVNNTLFVSDLFVTGDLTGVVDKPIIVPRAKKTKIQISNSTNEKNIQIVYNENYKY